jgi:hypothetical protein
MTTGKLGPQRQGGLEKDGGHSDVQKNDRRGARNMPYLSLRDKGMEGLRRGRGLMDGARAWKKGRSVVVMLLMRELTTCLLTTDY